MTNRAKTKKEVSRLKPLLQKRATRTKCHDLRSDVLAARAAPWGSPC